MTKYYYSTSEEGDYCEDEAEIRHYCEVDGHTHYYQGEEINIDYVTESQCEYFLDNLADDHCENVTEEQGDKLHSKIKACDHEKLKLLLDFFFYEQLGSTNYSTIDNIKVIPYVKGEHEKIQD